MQRHERTLDRSEILAMVERLGGRIDRRGKHYVVRDSDDRRVTVIATTGSLNGRVYLNVRAALKRADLWQPWTSRELRRHRSPQSV